MIQKFSFVIFNSGIKTQPYIRDTKKGEKLDL